MFAVVRNAHHRYMLGFVLSMLGFILLLGVVVAVIAVVVVCCRRRLLHIHEARRHFLATSSQSFF